jgi:hypothetical protein
MAEAAYCQDRRMIYDVTPSGPKGFQVRATRTGGEPYIVGNFASLVEAEAFAQAMRRLDAGQSPSAEGRDLSTK